MKIGILGSGDVGKALARGFASRNHEVMMSSREPEKLAEFVVDQNGRVRSGTFKEAATFGELIVIATLFSGTKHAIDLAGPANFAGKPVIDCTNPLKFEEGKLPALSIGFDNSAGEEVQRWLPDAKVVKAFNSIGNQFMVDPKLPGGPPTMFIAGNDDSAKKTVTGLIESLGWQGAVSDLGGIDESRYLEPMCIVWVHYGIRTGSWDHALKMLRA
ncbi:MAG TPA: NAD(P)-binding domain-containing protein [Candidatus Rubrimentiphilum sp.]|nr:NAD(P)-binding domain-containing protein [Candidatus Rubrimentiphilum sp.]